MRKLSTMVRMESDGIIFERLGCQTCSNPACSVKPGQKSKLLFSGCTVIVSRYMPQEYFE
jgi:hypothetical protein